MSLQSKIAAALLTVGLQLVVTYSSFAIDACVPAGSTNAEITSKVSLIGSLVVDTTSGIATATVINNAPAGTCPISVGIASYRKFTESYEGQQSYDWRNSSDNGQDLLPGAQITFRTTVPTCAASVYVFTGNAVTSNYSATNDYAANGRLLASYHTNTDNHQLGGTQLSSPAPQICTCPTTTFCPYRTPTVTPTPTQTEVVTATPTPIPGVTVVSTATPTVTPTATQTSIATQTPVATPTNALAPICDAGGPYNSNIACSNTAVEIQLSGAGSSNPQGGPLAYTWTTTCTGGTISEASFSSAKLSAVTKNPDGSSISCKVQLTVTNASSVSASCEAPVAGGVCVLDCNGTINGPVAPDQCGICGGNGSSCLNCSTVDVKGVQFTFDTSSAELRNRILSLNRIYETLAKNTRSSSKLATARKDIKSSDAKANAGYQKLWTTSYTAIPPVVTSCASSLCVNVSTTSAKGVISSGIKNLLTIAESVSKKINALPDSRSSNKNVKTPKAKAKTLLSEATSLEKKVLTSLDSVPASTSSCGTTASVGK